MKKMRMISILIVIVLSTLSTTTVLAAEFTLHNGVKFGMNMNEVSTAETNADFSVDKTEDSIIVMGFHKPCGIHDSEYLTVSGTIAGYDGEIEYHFNNDSLESAIYFLGWGQMPGSCTNQFDDINKTLSEKYGDADDSIQEMLERRYLDSCYYSTGYSLDNLHTMTISALNAYKCSQDDGL